MKIGVFFDQESSIVRFDSKTKAQEYLKSQGFKRLSVKQQEELGAREYYNPVTDCSVEISTTMARHIGE